MDPNTTDATEAADPIAELRDGWARLSVDDRTGQFRGLARDEAEELFLGFSAHDQEELILALPAGERRSWMRLLPPDDAADVVQAADPPHRDTLMALLDDHTRKEVTALMAYAEDDAGGLMNPRFARLRLDMTVDEAIKYLQRQAREHPETIHYTYVLDAEQKVHGVVSLRSMFTAAGNAQIRDVMERDIVTVDETMDQEALSQVFAHNDLIAIPVVDALGRMKGIVTVDDIVDEIGRAHV